MALPAVFTGMAAVAIGKVLVKLVKWIVWAAGIYAVTLVGFSAIETFFADWIQARFGALPSAVAQLLLLCNVPQAAAMLMAAQIQSIQARGARKLILRKGGAS